MKKKLVALLSVTLAASMLLSMPVMASTRLKNGQAKTLKGIVYTYNENYTGLLGMKAGNCCSRWDFDYTLPQYLTFDATQFDAYLTKLVESRASVCVDDNGHVFPQSVADLKAFVAQVHPDGIFAINWLAGYIYTMSGTVIELSNDSVWGVNEFVNGTHEFEARFTVDRASGKMTFQMQPVVQ